jgi:hypothetical protein
MYNLTQALKKAKEQQQQKQSQQNQAKNNSKKNGKPNQPNKNQSQPQSKSPSNSEKKQAESKPVNLSDRKTERTLDELVKKEMETKKKFDGVKGSGTGVKRTGKDW